MYYDMENDPRSVPSLVLAWPTYAQYWKEDVAVRKLKRRVKTYMRSKLENKTTDGRSVNGIMFHSGRDEVGIPFILAVAAVGMIMQRVAAP